MNSSLTKQKVRDMMLQDPWDPRLTFENTGTHQLTSVEFTVTNLCNMRCEHCAVGDFLTMTEAPHIPLETVFRKLDEIETLQTISLTGGEPSFHPTTMKEIVMPLLKYAKARGLKTQMNSNLTLNLERYEQMAPYLDVMHISFNYTRAEQFREVGFAHSGRPVSEGTANRLYENMVNNARALSEAGLFVSAESMINFRTHRMLAEIHQLIVEMGCLRHEVHPMYPSSFASNLPLLTLSEIRQAVVSLLDGRDENIWMLFGTLPFYACNDSIEDQKLVKRLNNERNVTVRNDPDGRNRLNINMFTGDVYVTDFSDVPSFGNVQTQSLNEIFRRWQAHPLNQAVSCYCATAKCCGPNLLVKDAYYPEVDFLNRKAF